MMLALKFIDLSNHIAREIHWYFAEDFGSLFLVCEEAVKIVKSALHRAHSKFFNK